MIINLISTNGGINIGNSKFLELDEKKNNELANRIKDELFLFSGRIGKKCYSPSSWEDILKDDDDKAIKRANMCLENKHHSIFDHAYLTFEMRDIPKFLLMILNNEYLYTTSEQSARYTDFSKSGKTEQERHLYVKWTEIITEAIKEVYKDKFTEKEAHKLAQENARYMISVFVNTSIIHTLSLRQLNNIVVYLREFVEGNFKDKSEQNKKFMAILKPYIEEFIDKMSPFIIDGYSPKFHKGLAIFKEQLSTDNKYDTEYRINYDLSFAAFAQEHRHRSIKHSISLYETPNYYIPKIVIKIGREKEWVEDIKSVSEVFPQGMLINVTEKGDIEDFIGKCHERCCGRAQLEIEDSTNKSLSNFRKFGTDEVKKYIKEKTGEATSRCGFPGQKCTEGCKFGTKQIERLI